MYETPLETLIYKFITFITGVLGTIVNFCVIVGLFYILFYIILRFLVCRNDKEEWEWVANDLRIVAKQLISSLKEVSVATLEIAKDWSSEKIEDLRGKKHEQE